MPLYDAVKDLPLTIERVELEPHALPLGFMTRRTTVVHLHGAGREGVGEDVTYEGAAPRHGGARARRRAHARLVLPLVADAPGYRRWGLESAALDLALRQAGRRSRRGRPRAETRAVRRLAAQGARAARALPDLRFKLDALDSWTDEVVAELAATGAVDVVDLKGCTRATGSTRRRRPSSTAASPQASRARGSRTRG